MKKELRLVVTWICDRNCSYCCNNYPVIQDSFGYMFDPGEIEQYDVIKVTGGEPLMVPNKIKTICDWARSDADIYVYTNGFDMEYWPVLYSWGVSGINYSPHDEPTPEQMLQLALARADGIPIRVMLRSDMATPQLKQKLAALGCTVDSWCIGKCETVEEDRFILTDI